MKFLYVIVAALMLTSLILLPSLSFAQSTLLPERTETTISGEKATSSSVSSQKQGDNSTWMIVIGSILLMGLFFIFLEIAIIPGFGIAGIAGGILLFVSLGLAFWKLSTALAVVTTILAVVGVVLLIMFMFFVLPHTRLGKTMILEEKAPAPDELIAVEDPKRFLGAQGVAVSNLRPSGIVKIADERVDVITDGDFIEKGSKIKVIKISGGRAVVALYEE